MNKITSIVYIMHTEKELNTGVVGGAMNGLLTYNLPYFFFYQLNLF